MAALLSTGHLLDGPSEVQSRIDGAQSAQDAERTAQRTARMEKAASRMCGGNGAWSLLADNEIQCINRRSLAKRIAKVAL